MIALIWAMCIQNDCHIEKVFIAGPSSWQTEQTDSIMQLRSRQRSEMIIDVKKV